VPPNLRAAAAILTPVAVNVLVVDDDVADVYPRRGIRCALRRDARVRSASALAYRRRSAPPSTNTGKIDEQPSRWFDDSYAMIGILVSRTARLLRFQSGRGYPLRTPQSAANSRRHPPPLRSRPGGRSTLILRHMCFPNRQSLGCVIVRLLNPPSTKKCRDAPPSIGEGVANSTVFFALRGW